MAPRLTCFGALSASESVAAATGATDSSRAAAIPSRPSRDNSQASPPTTARAANPSQPRQSWRNSVTTSGEALNSEPTSPIAAATTSSTLRTSVPRSTDALEATPKQLQLTCSWRPRAVAISTR